MDKQFFAVNTTGSIPEILVYGLLGTGEGMIGASEFVANLKALEKPNTTINVRINSGGGSIFEGLAMYNAMKNSTAEVNTYVDGLAASMASVLALGGKKCYMSNMSRIMTHKAKGVGVGGADAMRQTAAMMDSLEDTMAIIYASKSGKTKEDAKQLFLCNGDKWMTPKEAMEEKLVDGIYDASASINIPTDISNEKDLWEAYSAHYNISNYNLDKMEKIVLTADQLGKLNLKAGSSATEMQAAIDSLIETASKVPALEAKAQKAESDLKEFKKEKDAEQIASMLKAALDAKKLTVKLSETLKAKFANDVAGLKEVLENMQAYVSITGSIETGAATDELAKLSAKSYSELDKEGTLPKLKALSLEVFKSKFKEEFGKEYTGA